MLLSIFPSDPLEAFYAKGGVVLSTYDKIMLILAIAGIIIGIVGIMK